MNDFTSLWDDAGAAAESEAAERRLATAKVASSALWPFLARSADFDEFGQRLNLVEADLAKAASAGGVEVADLVTTYTRQFGLLAEARKATAASQCTCGHASAHHSAGGVCQDCGCKEFHAAATAAKDPNAYLDDQCPGCGKQGRFAGAENTCPTCQGEADAYANSRSDEDTWNPRSAYASYLASLKTALEEGQDPLEWIEGEGGVGQPEKVGGHSEGDEQTTPNGNQAYAAKTAGFDLGLLPANNVNGHQVVQASNHVGGGDKIPLCKTCGLMGSSHGSVPCSGSFPNPAMNDATKQMVSAHYNHYLASRRPF